MALSSNEMTIVPPKDDLEHLFRQVLKEIVAALSRDHRPG